MKITDEMIDYIGILARLRLEEDEKESAKVEMEKIINYMDKLNEVDTTGIEAMSHAFPVKNVFRKDEVRHSVTREELSANAPRNMDGGCQVPKTVE